MRSKRPASRVVLRAVLRSALLAGTALLITASALASDANDTPAKACAGQADMRARTAVRIIDGETLGLDDGSELRLFGALAPRALDAGAHAGTWPLEEAARQALAELVLGKSMDIRSVRSAPDRYGRRQGNAFLRPGSTSSGPIWLQLALVERGLARVHGKVSDLACAVELLAAERMAREERRGLWSEAAYEVRAAEDTEDLMRRLSTFQLVEGRVPRVGVTSGRIYLNFGGRRGRFSASVRQRDRGLLGQSADDPGRIEGRRVRVRGWLEDRSGPAIDLSADGAFELLDGEKAPAVASNP